MLRKQYRAYALNSHTYKSSCTLLGIIFTIVQFITILNNTHGRYNRVSKCGGQTAAESLAGSSRSIQELASVQHARKRTLLRAGNGQRVHALDPYPHLSIGAVVRGCRLVSVAFS